MYSEIKNGEINSFISKFNQLWHYGFDAHLDLHTHAGSAWVGLQVNLGTFAQPQYSQNKKHPVLLVNDDEENVQLNAL